MNKKYIHVWILILFAISLIAVAPYQNIVKPTSTPNVITVTPKQTATQIATQTRTATQIINTPTRTPTQTSVVLTPTRTPTNVVTRTPTPIATATQPSGGVDRVNCTGYPQPRVFLESQAWWLTTPGRNGTDNGHIHIGTCFPYAQNILGPIVFDIQVILHDNPGEVHVVLVDVMTDGGVTNLVNLPVSYTCDGTCEFWVHVTADTTRLPYDGRQEFRFRAKVDEPDGKEMFPTTGWQAYVRNGRTNNDYRSSDLTIARGWYTGAGYANAQLNTTLPTSPVSGIWTFNVKLAPGSGGIPVTYHHVLLDANFHAGIPGTVLREGTGEFSGNISLDTRTLSNGPHKLLLKADADESSGSTNSGVLVIRFNVQN